MLFNSIDFIIYFIIVFNSYWFIFNKSIRLQNLFILVASYFFYAYWDWRFLSLIIISSIADYYIGLFLYNEKTERKRLTLLILSLIINLSILGFFKYFNFFIENFVSIIQFFDFKINLKTLNIILPIGISFYTFQTLSYTIDIYNKKIKPTNDIVVFLAFVSFFPQLVAGPIERASNLLPQFLNHRVFDYNLAKNGLKQILWGFFKKVVIADNCAIFVDTIFNNPAGNSGSTILLAGVFFAFQIYGDFSGYSDIAIGISKLFGFKLKKNFNYPYFSRDIAEFWRRWHISLSTWFRDYIYIPLGGNLGTTKRKIINIFIIFTISGFWHGANWTFICWGLLNAIYFLPLLLLHKNRRNTSTIAKDRIFPTLLESIKIFNTFILVTIGWIFFRSNSLQDLFYFLSEIFSRSLFSRPIIDTAYFNQMLILIFILLLIEWNNREKEYGLMDIFNSYPLIIRWLFYSLIIFFIGMFMQTNETPFIYFQF